MDFVSFTHLMLENCKRKFQLKLIFDRKVKYFQYRKLETIQGKFLVFQEF